MRGLRCGLLLGYDFYIGSSALPRGWNSYGGATNRCLGRRGRRLIRIVSRLMQEAQRRSRNGACHGTGREEREERCARAADVCLLERDCAAAQSLDALKSIDLFLAVISRAAWLLQRHED